MTINSQPMNQFELQELLQHIAISAESFEIDEQNNVYIKHEGALIQIALQRLEGIGLPGFSSIVVTAYPDSNQILEMNESLSKFVVDWNENHGNLGDTLCGFAFEDDSRRNVTISSIKMYTKLTPEDFSAALSSLVADAKMLNDKYLSTT